MSSAAALPLEVLPFRWMLYRLPAGTPWPETALRSPWAFLVRTPEEVALLLPEALPPPEGSRGHGPLAALRVATTLDFNMVGILATLSHVLAQAQVPILALSTYDTDYLFLPEARLKDALKALHDAGYPLTGTLPCEPS